MNWVDGVKNVGAVVAAITIGYGVVIKAGWVIGRAEAATMIELAVQQSAAQTNQSLLDEAKARRLADLQFQKTLAEQKVADLLDNDNRSAGEDYELEQAKKLVDQLDAQIAGLQ